MALPRRYKYNLSHNVATYGRMMEITPFLRMEVAPGDTIQGNVGLLTRLSALKKAVLTNMTVDTYMFYVPHRLVWDQWEDFIAAGPNPTTPITPPGLHPATGSINHLFMMADGSFDNLHNTLPLRAYNLIKNEFFRDEGEAVVLPDNTSVNTTNLKRCYHSLIRQELESGDPQMVDVVASQVSAEEILRKVAAQKLQMRRETYGSRYIDVLRSYGVRVSYQMLQRPEVIHASKRAISISDVVATADGAQPTDAQLGDLAGHGVAGQTIKIRRRQFPEHGTLLGLAVVRPDPMAWTIRGHFDSVRNFDSYYDPGLTTLPPVGLETRDLFSSQNEEVATQTIGYHPWGEWYRREPNRMRGGLGQFVTDCYNEGADKLDMSWQDAINGVSPESYDGIFTDTSFQHFQITSTNRIKARRLIPHNQTNFLSKGI